MYLQREAFWLIKHSIIIRSVTEWTDIIEKGWGTLVPPEAERIAMEINTQRIHKDAPDLIKLNPYEKIRRIINA